MNFIYLLVGITVWIMTVSFSSHALINYENKKQLDKTKSYLEDIKQKAENTRIIIEQAVVDSSKSIITESSSSSSVLSNNPTAKIETKVFESPTGTQPVKKFWKDEEEGDD